MNVAPAAGIPAMSIIVMAALNLLAVCVLIPMITFLRLRIAELKRAAPPPKGSRIP